MQTSLQKNKMLIVTSALPLSYFEDEMQRLKRSIPVIVTRGLESLLEPNAHLHENGDVTTWKLC